MMANACLGNPIFIKLAPGGLFSQIACCFIISSQMACLNTDFLGNFFPGSAALLRLSEDIQEVPGSLCWCGRKATMNTRVDGAGRVIKEGAQVLIDNQAEIRYIGLCYRHWREGKSHG